MTEPLKDAGEYSEPLTEVLQRIPNIWGRWIGCGKGWYPIIARLHEDLSRIDPGYEVHQVKEKFGGLRFYARFSPDAFRRCEDLIRAAEQESEHTCEECGAPGELSIRRGWWRTLCASCRKSAGPTRDGDWYEPITRDSTNEESDD